MSNSFCLQSEISRIKTAYFFIPLIKDATKKTKRSTKTMHALVEVSKRILMMNSERLMTEYLAKIPKA